MKQPKPGTSLLHLFPKLATQWHAEKNGTMGPADLIAGSSTKVWWKCPAGVDHEWFASLDSRTRGSGCPYCANQKVSVTNSLETLAPHLLRQWDHTRNKPLKPSGVVASSARNIWWVCPNGPDHQWQTSVRRRVGSSNYEPTGCPFCSNKRVSTTNSLATLFPGIATQLHPSKNGPLRAGQIIAGSNKKLWWACSEAEDHEWEASSSARTLRNSKCPFCAGRKVALSNSLLTQCPKIAAEWHPSLNEGLSPENIYAGSTRKVWWLCETNSTHIWKTSPSKRRTGTACPKCGHARTADAKRVPEKGQSLAELVPELLHNWDYEVNGNLSPATVKKKSHQKVAWKCDAAFDHRWFATVARMTSALATGCPFCAGKEASSTNNLRDLCPEAAELWDHDRNKKLKPVDATIGSGKKAAWRCPKSADHRWVASISSVVKSHKTGTGSGCPFCRGLKSSATNNFQDHGPAHAISQWDYDRNGSFNLSNFVVSSNKSVWWKCNKGADHLWKATINTRSSESGDSESKGCPFCRGLKPSSTNNLRDHRIEIASEWDFKKNEPVRPEDVTTGSGKSFWWQCDAADDHSWKATVGNRTRPVSGGCPFCRGYFASSTNNLKDFGRPIVVKQWDYERNFPLRPEEVPVGSGKSVWWRCEKGNDHLWKALIGDRSSPSGTDCPCCAGRKLAVSNSLEKVFPQIAADWHPDRNGSLLPHKVLSGTHLKYWWRCKVADDHVWKAAVNSRTNGRNCPSCAGIQASETNSLESLFPEISKQWHYEKNDPTKPSEVVAGSGKKHWWRCPAFDTHEWKASAGNRTRLGQGCPHCTLTPRSAQEIRLAYELSSLIDFDLDAHKIRFAGRLRDVDILIEDIKTIIEFDGSYWHRNKVEKDIQKTLLMEKDGWRVIRVRELPLDSIHANDVMVPTQSDTKTVADLVFKKITELTDLKIPHLKKYLDSNGPWREEEAVEAIRSYQAENAAKKAAREAKRKK